MIDICDWDEIAKKNPLIRQLLQALNTGQHRGPLTLKYTRLADEQISLIW